MTTEEFCQECNGPHNEDYGEKKVSKWEIIEGDYNDIFARYEMVGTEEEIYEYVKNQFDPKVFLEKAYDIGSDSIAYAVDYEPTDDDGNVITVEEWEEKYGPCYESRIQYYVEATELDDDEAEEYEK